MNFSVLSFDLFKFKIYGVFLAIAFAVGVWKFYKGLQKKGYSVDRFIHSFWHWVLIGCLVGRIFRLILSPEIFERYGVFGFFAFWDGGLVFYGALLGFLVSAWYELRSHAGAFFRWLDVSVFPFLISLWILDWGGFLTGSVYGTPAEVNGVQLPWGIRYETFGVDILTPVHPVTLYAFIAHVWLFSWLKRREKAFSKYNGKMGMFMLVLVLWIDFILSFIRFQEGLLLGGLYPSQWIVLTLSLFASAMYMYWFSRKKVVAKKT